MRTLPAAATAHLSQDVTTLAICWMVTRTDGVKILGTEFDRNLVIASGTYAGTYRARAGITGSNVRSSSDMAVDNMEVTGALRQEGDLALVDLSSQEIEAGLFDEAEVVLFLVNWEAPDDFQIVLRGGTLGGIMRTSDGEYRTELRGLTQRLSQNFVRTYSPTCDAELGDDRCTVDIAALTYTGTVTAVTSNRRFEASVSFGSPAPDANYFNGGVVTWTSGENQSFSMEVKRDDLSDSPSEVHLYLPMPYDIEVGDTFTIKPSCDKSPAMCKGRFNNLLNFRGHGSLIPGIGEMMIFGGQTAEKKPKSATYLQWPRPEEED